VLGLTSNVRKGVNEEAKIVTGNCDEGKWGIEVSDIMYEAIVEYVFGRGTVQQIVLWKKLVKHTGIGSDTKRRLNENNGV
jgi:hypothetical protein